MAIVALLIALWPYTLAGFLLWIASDIYSTYKEVRNEIREEKEYEELFGSYEE